MLVGQRRVGKSYLLRQIAKRMINEGTNPKNIFYINKEFTGFDFIDNYNDLEASLGLYKANLKPEGKKYLFINEIQNVEGWEHFVNSHSQDFVEPYEIFVSGSNSKMLSGDHYFSDSDFLLSAFCHENGQSSFLFRLQCFYRIGPCRLQSLRTHRDHSDQQCNQGNKQENPNIQFDSVVKIL